MAVLLGVQMMGLKRMITCRAPMITCRMRLA